MEGGKNRGRQLSNLPLFLPFLFFLVTVQVSKRRRIQMQFILGRVRLLPNPIDRRLGAIALILPRKNFPLERLRLWDTVI